MSVAWVFPGQGSQVVGMGRDLYEVFPEVQALFDEADMMLGLGLTRLCFEGPEEQLTATENAQPALLTVSAALLRAIEVLGGAPDQLRPQLVAGHSLGEYSAMLAGGALDFGTALRLVRRRGRFMAAAREGTMAAVIGLDEEPLERLCAEVSEILQMHAETASTVVIANYNAPGQLVISGGVLAIEHASLLAKERGAKRVLPLKVSAAFHSPLMINAAEGMARVLEEETVSEPRIPLIANVTAEALTKAEDLRREIVSQVVAPVRWIASIQRMQALGVDTFVEIGPGKVLTGLIKRIAPEARLINLATAADVQSFVNMDT
jgi:[acyl-carrier-protein] S-malonyltransferase